MLGVLSDLPDEPKQWAFEFKWDGMRVISFWDGEKLRLESRTQRNITASFPEFRDLGQAIGDCAVMLDGEILALDQQGRPNFTLMQRRMTAGPAQAMRVAAEVPVVYYLFDVLFLNDREMISLPYTDRRAALAALELKHPRCQIPPSYVGEGEAMLEVARERGLEGVMAKRLTSLYQAGQRSPNWRKIKIVRRQEFVVGGWTTERNRPQRIGSLLLGYHDEDGQLRYAGRVGSGFSAEDHKRLVSLLSELERPISPFSGPVPLARYVAPRLVVEVEYRRWYPGGNLQQTAYKGLRPDKPAVEVIREQKEASDAG